MTDPASPVDIEDGRPTPRHAEHAVRVLLAFLGYDIDAPELADVPQRVVRALTMKPPHVAEYWLKALMASVEA